MAKIIITGSGGMLGQALVKILKDKGEDFVGFPHSELDITDREKVIDKISSFKPLIVMHTAAWTDVDGCETDPKKAFMINEGGTENVAMACKKNNSRLMYISTDFIFNGEKGCPYVEDDSPDPINVYGESKLAGEEKIKHSLENYYIIRSSWLFGPGRHNFVTKILEMGHKKNVLKIVKDQIGTPTYTRDLAQAAINLMENSAPGVYHITNKGFASRYDWARAILEYSSLGTVNVVPIKHNDFHEVARRPLFSALGTNRSKIELPYWKEALKDYLCELSQV